MSPHQQRNPLKNNNSELENRSSQNTNYLARFKWALFLSLFTNSNSASTDKKFVLIKKGGIPYLKEYWYPIFDRIRTLSKSVKTNKPDLPIGQRQQSKQSKPYDLLSSDSNNVRRDHSKNELKKG
jgi:hypothetical protein